MSGYLSIARRARLQNLLSSHEFTMLLLSMSVGVMAGLFTALVRLHLGLPGHKALFWMTPVLVARLVGRCRIGATAGGLSAAATTYALGANLAGGLIGLPAIAVAGAILDYAANFVEKHKSPSITTVLVLGIAGISANLVCLAKRMMLPAGWNPHFAFDLSATWCKVLSYAFFGLISGVLARLGATLIHGRQQKGH